MAEIDKEAKFPSEQYIELENNPYLWGRITIHQIKEKFMAEVDIVYKETHKIFQHVSILYDQYSEEEAIVLAVQNLKNFLEKQHASS